MTNRQATFARVAFILCVIAMSICWGVAFAWFVNLGPSMRELYLVIGGLCALIIGIELHNRVFA